MKILIITNLENECSIEDVWIAEEFSKDGHEVKLVNKYYDPKLDNEYDIFIKRYSWIEDIDTWELGGAESDYETRILEKNLPRINFDGKFDNQGKTYLSQLFKLGYPVVPTISNIDDLELLGNPQKYLIKPVNGYASFGILESTKENIHSMWDDNYVIQPFINFDAEVQFYFVGNKFEHAQIFRPKKLLSHENAVKYSPTIQELEIASALAELNGANFNGVQRIDFLKVGDKLFLSELEDDSPYLDIESLSLEERKRFINDFKQMTYEYYNSLKKDKTTPVVKEKPKQRQLKRQFI